MKTLTTKIEETKKRGNNFLIKVILIEIIMTFIGLIVLSKIDMNYDHKLYSGFGLIVMTLLMIFFFLKIVAKETAVKIEKLIAEDTNSKIE